MEKASIQEVMSVIRRFHFLGVCDNTKLPLNQSCSSYLGMLMFSGNKSSRLTNFPAMIRETTLKGAGE